MKHLFIGSRVGQKLHLKNNHFAHKADHIFLVPLLHIFLKQHHNMVMVFPNPDAIGFKTTR